MKTTLWVTMPKMVEKSASKPLTLTIATMVYNVFPAMQETLARLLVSTSGTYRFIFLDNGSAEPLERFLFEGLRPHWEARCDRPIYIRNKDNVGTVLGWQKIIEWCDSEILMLIHNDVQILQYGWDAEVLQLFAHDPKLGLASFFGCPGVMANGGRGGVTPGRGDGWSNMSDAERHGVRINEKRPIAVPDSFAMILRREMLQKGGGLDLRFAPDHVYDRALGLQSLALGYHNMVLPVPCNHLSMRTRATPQYEQWLSRTLGTPNDEKVCRGKDTLFHKIWGPCLPLYVNEDFSFAKTDPLTGEPTGRDVLGYDWRAA